MSRTQLMALVVQCYIPILSEWAIWCAKGRVYCTSTPKTRCNLSSKEHQSKALTAAWKEQGAASLTVGTPSKPFFHFHFSFLFFLFYSLLQNTFQLNTLRCVMGIDFTLRSLFFFFSKCTHFALIFTLCDLTERGRMVTYSTATET